MSDEFDWLDDEPAENLPAAPSRPRRKKSLRPTALIVAERKLPLEKRVYARILADAVTVAQADEVYAELGYNFSKRTLGRWRQEPDFINCVVEIKGQLARATGFSKDKVILDAEKVREAAMTPKPILYKGMETGHEEINGGVAMRAIELQGKALGIGDNKGGNLVVSLDIDFSGPQGETIEGEVEVVEDDY